MNNLRQLSFRKKAVIFLLVISLVPVVGVGLISYEIARDSLYQRISADLSVQAVHVMDQIDRFIYERHNNTQLLISDSSLADTAISSEAKTAILKDYLLNLGLYDNIHLIDMNGRVVSSTYSGADYPEFGNEEWFLTVKKLFHHTGDVGISPFSGKPTLFFANMIQDDKKNAVGVIVAELHWPVIVEFLTAVGAPRTIYLMKKLT